MITAIVVWGAIPFVAITVYAGPDAGAEELVEAASIDGANACRIFRDMTLPILKPIFVILTSLSMIWNFQVFTQIWIILERAAGVGLLRDVDLLVRDVLQVTSQYGLGSAIALVTVAILLCVTFVYIRQMVRIGELD